METLLIRAVGRSRPIGVRRVVAWRHVADGNGFSRSVAFFTAFFHDARRDSAQSQIIAFCTACSRAWAPAAFRRAAADMCADVASAAMLRGHKTRRLAGSFCATLHDAGGCCILMPAGLTGNQYVFRAGWNSPPAVCRPAPKGAACEPASARASMSVLWCVSRARGVSRSGAKPEPTVRVRMEEDVQMVLPAQTAAPRPRANVPFGGAIRARSAIRVPHTHVRVACLFAMP